MTASQSAWRRTSRTSNESSWRAWHFDLDSMTFVFRSRKDKKIKSVYDHRHRPIRGERSTIRPTHQGERFERSKKLKISDINKSSDPSRGNGSKSRPTHQGERSTMRPTRQGGTVYSTSDPSRGNGFNGGKNQRRAETPPSSSPSLSSPSSGKGMINLPSHFLDI